MKKNNMYRLVNKFNLAIEKAACMRMATAARKTCSFFYWHDIPRLDTKKYLTFWFLS